MPCSMVSRGERLDLIVPGGEKLGELLARAGERAGGSDPFKIEGVMEVAGDSASLYILGIDGGVTHVCVEVGAETFRGEDAASWLSRRAGDEVARGFLEVMKLSRDAYELDASMESGAQLRRPRSIRELVEAERPPRPAAAVTERAAPPRAAPRIELAASEMNGYTLALTMTELIMCSELLGTYKALDEARGHVEKASRDDPERYYRLLVEVRDGSIVNLFYRAGRPCAVIVLQPGGLEARLSRASPESVLASLPPDQVKSARVYRLECTREMETLLGKCTQPSQESREERVEEPRREKTGEEKTGERRRRGFWLILRRR